MAKATLQLPDGTTVTIDGTHEEIQKILAYYGNQIEAKPKRKETSRKAREKTGKNTSKSTGRVGPTGLIKELKEEGYFKSKRKIKDIQMKLEEKGFIYAVTSLSPALFKLTRQRELRRLREKGGWFYVAN